MASEHMGFYLNRIESQHKGRTRYMAHVSALLEMVDGAYGTIHGAVGQFDLATATGSQLDVIGNRVGAPRRVDIPGSSFYGYVLDDESYRAFIYSRIFRNHWDGTAETFQGIWDHTLGNIVDARFYDNQDMSVTITLRGTVPPVIMAMLLAGDFIPKPAAVKYNIAFDNSDEIVVSADTDCVEIVYMYVSDDTYNGEPYIGVEYCGATDIEDWEENSGE